MPGSNIDDIRKMIEDDMNKRDLNASESYQKRINDPNASLKQNEYDTFDKRAIDIKRGAIEAAPATMSNEELDVMNTSIQDDMDKTAMPYHRGEPDIKENIPYINSSMAKEEAKRFFDEEKNLQKEEEFLDASKDKLSLSRYLMEKSKLSVAKGVLKQKIENAIKAGKIDREYYESLKNPPKNKTVVTSPSEDVLEVLDEIDKKGEAIKGSKPVSEEEIKKVEENVEKRLSDEELIKKARKAALKYINDNKDIYERIDDITHASKPSNRVTNEEIDAIDEKLSSIDESKKDIEFNKALENALDNIDAGVKIKMPEKDIKPSISIEEINEDMNKHVKIEPREKTTIVTPSITLETINPDVHSHKDILEKIIKTYELNNKYQNQINSLGNDRLARSLKKEMYKEIKNNIKLIHKLNRLDETYKSVLVNVESLKQYEDMKPSGLLSKISINKKIKSHIKEIDRLCGKNFEYLPKELYDEINKTIGRVDKSKEIKIVSKKKVDIKNKKKLIGKGIVGAVLALSFGAGAFATGYVAKNKETVNDILTKESNPVIEMMNIGKKIASQNGISDDIIYELYNNSNKALDDAIDMFSKDKELDKGNSKHM